MEPKTIYLKDYRPSSFLIDDVFLEIDIFEDHTIVSSRLKMHKSPVHKEEKLNLELKGEELELIEIKLNGVVLASDRFQVSSEDLKIFNISEDSFIIETVSKINPGANKALEGFYQSGAQLCTQCEPEGFRKITYFIDRPDVMARYKTKMIADKKNYPYLLSNGNRIGLGDLAFGRHWVEWEDPFKKPSYLFAMVAGDFDVVSDSYTTMKGRKVALEIYVDKGNLAKTPHAMESLKMAMKWDEDTFGLEYDLDIYMIVAVDSFNMGAMENKGLNIFNSTYTLADEKSATDHDFQNIQGVIGHEYFHNWTGNRVTCRDWFQLTLKEGLTVFRDQEFSSDMLSRAVKRLEDVRLLKESQFAEDAGPMAHPIRPSSYIEINNFYTRTVYEKGSEVIRMIHTLIGKEKFRKGMDKYFELYDGSAATTEDFVHAMEVASGRDLTQFKNWYSRPGTPTLKMTPHFDGKNFTLEVEQIYPHNSFKGVETNVLHMPIKIALFSKEGKTLPEKTFEVKNLKEKFTMPMDVRAIPSLNRGFTAPVIIEYPYEFSDLIYLMGHDDDSYCRYEATQKVYNTLLKKEYEDYTKSGKLNQDLGLEFKNSFELLLNDSKIDMSFKSYLLELPSENSLSQEIHLPDFEAIHLVHGHFLKKLGSAFFSWFATQHEKLSTTTHFELTPKAFGERSLKNQCLSYLVASDKQEATAFLNRHYDRATNMTEEIHALAEFVGSGVPLAHPSIQKFYQKWKHDSLVMLKWFGVLASYTPRGECLKRLEVLEKDPLFLKQVPNYLRSLYLQFAKNNLTAFHAEDGSGYEFLSERIKLIDGFNPQVASRASSAFSLIGKVDQNRQAKMKKALQTVMESKPSRDTFEVISKYLS
jgi:aminopeptidase N